MRRRGETQKNEHAYSFGLSVDPQLFSSGALEGPREHQQTTCWWRLHCATRMEWVVVWRVGGQPSVKNQSIIWGSGWCAFRCQGGLENAEPQSRRPCLIFCAGKKSY